MMERSSAKLKVESMSPDLVDAMDRDIQLIRQRIAEISDMIEKRDQNMKDFSNHKSQGKLRGKLSWLLTSAVAASFFFNREMISRVMGLGSTVVRHPLTHEIMNSLVEEAWKKPATVIKWRSFMMFALAVSYVCLLAALYLVLRDNLNAVAGWLILAVLHLLFALVIKLVWGRKSRH
jgi:hypothetical protein